MRRFGRRPVAFGLVSLVLGVVGYEFWPRDETRISSLLNELCAQLNQTRDEASLARLRQFLRTALRPEVDVHVSELNQDVTGVDAVSARVEDLLTLPPLSFAWSSIEIHLSGRLARVDADLLITVRGSGEQHRDLRRTQVRLAKVSGVWQIEAIDIESVPSAEPEARP